MDGEKYRVEVDVDVTDSSLAEARDKIKNLGKDKVKIDVQADDKGSINNANNKINQVNQSAKTASKSAKSFGDTLKSALNIGSAAAITAKGFQAISQASRDAINAVKDFDKAIMDIRMATGDSYKEASNLVQSYNEFGKVLGATTTEVSQSADAWLRQGHSVKDTNTLIKDSMMLSKVAQLDSAEATEYLTSAMKGYKVAAEDVEGIVDKLTAVDLVSATDAGGLADGMSRVANTAANAGIEMDKLLGYLAATGEVTQESMSVIGNSFKTIFTRMSDIKANKLELIDEDGTKQTLSDVETVLNGIGIKLRESDNEFRNFGDVLDEVAARWDSFSTTQQGAIAKAFAGTRQQERFRVLMENYDKASDYMNVAADSAGSASEKFNAYLDSIEAKTKTLQATFESLSFNTISTQLVGDIIEASTAVLKFADDTNILEGALAGLAVAGAVKGFTALKTAITDIAVKMNNFSSALKMLKAGNIGTTEVEQLAKMTENLSKSQLKAVLSSEALTTEQRIAILTAHGMSTAEAEAALSSMGLASAEGAATATTFTLSGALKGLWATLMSNPLILVVAAVTAVVAAVSAYKQHLEEVRQAELDAGNAARDEVTNIISLYNAYSQANAAYKNNTGSHEELKSASSALTEALGIEQSKVEDLIQEYGSLDNALQQVTNDTLKDKLSDLTTGFSAAKKELQEAAKGGWFDSDEISVGFNESYADVLKKAGIDVIEREIQSYGAKIGTEYRVDLGDSSTYEGIVEMYDKLQKIRDALESEYGTEELADSSIYNSVNDKLNTFKEEYETVLGYIEDINKTVAQLSYNDYVSKNGVPETIEEYEKLRDSLIKTSKSNKDFVGSQEEIENSIKNTLADIPELADFIESYNQSLESTEDSAKGIVYTTEALETLTKKSKDASASVTKLNEVLNAQSTGQSITIDNYNSDELKDYQSALEYVNGSMQLNADKAREIAKAKVEEQTAINNANKELREAQYMENINQIEEYKRQLSEKNNLTDEEIQKIQQQISACEEQNNGYLAECDQLDVLNASLKESISTYNEWKAAQSASESGDMFDDTLTAIQKIDDTLNNTKYENYGKVGREDYKTSLDLIIPDSVNAENEKAVQKYLKSVSDMFTYDNDKNRAGLNIANFCDKAVEQGLMVFDKKKKEYQVAGGKMMEDFAKGLNLSMPMVQAMFGEMEEYGAKFDWGDEIFDTFGDGIVAAQKQITDLESEIDSLHKQKTAGVDIDDSKIKKAKKELKELKKQKEELTQKATVNIETNMKVDSELEDAEAELDGWKTKLKDKDLDAEAKVEVKAKIEDAKDKIDKLQKKKDKLQEPTQVEIQASLGNIDSQIANLQTKVNNFSDKEYCAKFNISEEDAKAKVNELQGKINKLKDKKTKIEVYAETKNANKDLNSLDKKEIKDKDFTVSVIDNATTVINRINNMQLHDKNVTITTTEKTVKTGGHGVNGTAHVSGTAKASGDWRDKQGGETLVGELGREIVVNPHTGKWYTVGDNGAEFVNIPKNAIVFNHQQTEDLLSKGFVASRAVALANGTALASGTAMVTGGIKVSAAQSSTQRTYPKSKTKSSSNTKNSKSKSNSKNNEKSNEKKEKTALEKFQEWIGKLFDWIEIKIQRQSEKIDKYISSFLYNTKCRG